MKISKYIKAAAKFLGIQQNLHEKKNINNQWPKYHLIYYYFTLLGFDIRLHKNKYETVSTSFWFLKVSKFSNLSRGWPKGSLFNSYYTEV